MAGGTLDGHPEVAGVELDLAVPERGRDERGGRGGRPIGLAVETAEVAVVAARAATALPLIVKLPALMADPGQVAGAVAAAGADALSAIAPVPAWRSTTSTTGSRWAARSGGSQGRPSAPWRSTSSTRWLVLFVSPSSAWAA